MRVNGVVGLVVGFIGVIIITSPGLTGAGSSPAGEIALLGAAFSYACGAVYARRNVRGLAPMIPAVFQVSFAAIITGTLALLFEHPWTATPDAQAVFSILWLGILGSGLAYLAVFRLFRDWGATRTTLVAYLIPVVGIVLGYLVLAEPVDARIIFGTALVIAGIGVVNSRFGRRRVFGRVPPVEAV
jgi:drug/metabolite transporter (DMT)-like permease